MKKLVFILACSIAIFSCSKEKSAGTKATATTSIHTTAQKMGPGNIGEVHINALSYCYDKLSQFGPASVSKDENGFEAMRELCANYLAGDLNVSMTKQDILLFYEDAGFNYANSVSWIEDQENVIATTIASVPQSEQALLSALFDAIKNSEDFNEFQTAANTILSNAANLPQSEQQEIDAYVNIALSSWIYWQEDGNVAKWNALFQTIGVHRLDPRATKIIAADVIGGVRGAIAGAGFAGVGALAGAMLGAPLSSAFTGLWCLL